MTVDKQHIDLGIGIYWGLVLILVLGLVFYPGDSIKTYDTILGKSITGIEGVPQCSDGIDNDGDLLIDFPDDIGCVDPTDDSEINAIGAGCGVGFDYGYPECKWEFVWTMQDRFANFDLSSYGFAVQERGFTISGSHALGGVSETIASFAAYTAEDVQQKFQQFISQNGFDPLAEYVITLDIEGNLHPKDFYTWTAEDQALWIGAMRMRGEQLAIAFPNSETFLYGVIVMNKANGQINNETIAQTDGLIYAGEQGAFDFFTGITPVGYIWDPGVEELFVTNLLTLSQQVKKSNGDDLFLAPVTGINYRRKMECTVDLNYPWCPPDCIGCQDIGECGCTFPMTPEGSQLAIQAFLSFDLLKYVFYWTHGDVESFIPDIWADQDTLPQICACEGGANDIDGDGVEDVLDNCPIDQNPLQEDLDFDKIGDVCDICSWNYDPSQADDDGDGIGNACDPTGGQEEELGTLTVLQNTCADGAGTLPNTNCLTYEVSCPNQPPITGQLRITEPSPGLEVKGTILYSTGGQGQNWWEGHLTQFGHEVIKNLAEIDGYRGIQRKWDTPWHTGTGGTKSVSCRYATLLNWIHDTYQEQGTALCASGNSGGAGEIAYALTRWNGADLLDEIVFTGGHPFSRLDAACGMVPEWIDTCINDIWPMFPMECEIDVNDPEVFCIKVDTADLIDSGFPEANGACANRDQNFDQLFLDQSVLSPDALLSYPETRVDFVQGLEDCTSAIPSAILHSAILENDPNALTSWNVYTGVDHGVHQTELGSQKIYEALSTECVLRHEEDVNENFVGLPFGSAVVTQDAFDCDGFTCYQIEMACPSLDNEIADIRVGSPLAVNRGTVTLSAGGGGQTYWGDRHGATSSQGVQDLRDLGFQTIEIKFPNGWSGGNGIEDGHAVTACRAATSFQWIYDNLHTGSSGGFCGTGNSGGAAQLGYAASRYDTNFFDLMVITEGPPVSRLDLGCIWEGDSELWYDQSNSEALDGAWGFPTDGTGPCGTHDPVWRTLEQESSVIYDTGRYNIPNTYISIMNGEISDNFAKPHGILYYNELLSNGQQLLSLDTVPGAGHGIHSTELGVEYIVNKIDAECFDRSQQEAFDDTVCGNGIMGPAEWCDDGNDIDGDGCSSICIPESNWACMTGNPSICFPISEDRDCSLTYYNLIPLSDLEGQSYLGRKGGLYPDGTNARPASHTTSGLDIANAIVPIDTNGNDNPDTGVIVMASIGMSNTEQEFIPFIDLVNLDPDINEKLVLVDLAQGGADIYKHTNGWTGGYFTTWSNIDQDLADAGLVHEQVQIIWLKHAIAGAHDPVEYYGGEIHFGFENHTEGLADLYAILIKDELYQRFPNLKQIYISGRTRGYNINGSAQFSPYGYHNSYGAKEVVSRQLSGEDFDFTGVDAVSPWISWGPYLYIDGLGSDNIDGGIPGRSDGLEWECLDTSADGAHPSTWGEAKVAQMLLDFFKSEPTAAPWFLAIGQSVCSDGVDNDGDGFIDYPNDFGCSSAQDTDETNNGNFQCNNGLDDDSDGLIDQNDPMCSAFNDDNEFAQCNDGVDNDADGWVDLIDPGCSGVNDNSESFAGATECSDQVDNDGDGFVDGNDQICTQPSDLTESAQCEDGLDNDGDGLFDLDDPGCSNSQDNDESDGTSQCQDGIDNDGDGAIDFPSDFSCSSPQNDDETLPPAHCQDGVDNDGDGNIDYPQDEGCESNQDNSEDTEGFACQLISAEWNMNNAIEGQIVTLTTLGSNCDGELIDITIYEDDFVFDDFVNQPGIITFVGETAVTTWITEYLDDGFGDPEYYFEGILVSDDTESITSGLLTVTAAVVEQCQDGVDNDGDGFIDYPNDFSCESAVDDDETNPLSECQNSLDDDGDGLFDLDDPGCADNQDNDESDGTSQCQDGVDNDGDGFIDFPDDFGCSSLLDYDETNNGNFQCNNGLDDDSDGFIDEDDPMCGTYDDDNEFAQCNDGIDNDGDGWIDLIDPGCLDVNDNIESFVGATECSDEVDNDGDGLIDGLDPMCMLPDDILEIAQCQDGIDNDGDFDIDYPIDSGCIDPNDDDESEATQRCEDGIDNDGDGEIDFPSDFSCDNPQDNNELFPQSQCQNLLDDDLDNLTDLADLGCSDNQDNNEYNISVESPITITLLAPLNNTETTETSIEFQYEITNFNLAEVCSFNLDEDDLLNLTNETNKFTIDGLEIGIHYWLVRCTDTQEGSYNSPTWIFTITGGEEGGGSSSSSSGSSSGGGSGGGGNINDPGDDECEVEWECGEWSECINGEQEQVCQDVGTCESEDLILTQECENDLPSPPPPIEVQEIVPEKGLFNVYSKVEENDLIIDYEITNVDGGLMEGLEMELNVNLGRSTKVLDYIDSFDVIDSIILSRRYNIGPLKNDDYEIVVKLYQKGEFIETFSESVNLGNNEGARVKVTGGAFTITGVVVGEIEDTSETKSLFAAVIILSLVILTLVKLRKKLD